MKIITHKDIENLKIPPETCYRWAEYMIANKSEALLPAKISMKPADGVFCNVMPSIVKMPDGAKFGGVKIVSRYPKREPSLDSKLILFDADSGEWKAILDANLITAMRTGAVAVHSLKLFAKKNFSSVGVMGLGNTARAAMSVFSAVNEGEVSVNLLKYKGQEALFAERFSSCGNLRFGFCETPGQLIGSSDVVISAVTYLSGDLCADEAFGKGILLIPVHTRGFTNCDLFFDKVFADDIDHVCHFKNFGKFRSFAEVSDVVNGKCAGRENDGERILVYNIGVAMHDVFFAANIYQMLAGRHLQEVDFRSPTEKFWV